ncbi:MAG TPA: type I secretion system permease/ATPase [Xanthobacteraceae bacterium]|nr:type I secretion system permease/ATPase [Xanthobacteraceae bacterium]
MSQLPSPPRQQPASSELASALASCRRAFLAIALFSGMSNVLMLTGALFMLEIYDRVMPSRSVPTLIALLMLAAGLYAAQAIIDTIRSRILVRVGNSLDETLSLRVYDALVRLPLMLGDKGDKVQPIRDLDAVRAFLSGIGPVALFDLPWLPIYLAICFLFHTYIGLTALGGAIILVALTVLTEMLTRWPTRSASQLAVARNTLMEASRRNAEAIAAMGMAARLARHWGDLNRSYVASSARASDVAGGLGAMSKALRLLLQSSLLAVGAWLVIHQESTPGIIIAGSILGARALAPVDLAIANWRGFVGARQSWQRLSRLLGHLPVRAAPMPLQAPAKTLLVQNAAVAPPGGQKIVCQDVNFALAAGRALGVIGPTASGKSSLARMLVGVWTPARGSVRLDGASLDQWSPETLGRHIGYLPQDVELFAGSVAQNIARFEAPADAEAVIAAAQAAGVHDLIINLPDGYETNVGDHGSALSAGQAQRIALARALYRDPFLVVLDEPNSNLDAEGDEALTRAILGVRARGGVVVVVAHRPSAVAGVDYILVMAKGRQQHFGPKEEILNRAIASNAQPPRALKVVPDQGGAR